MTDDELEALLDQLEADLAADVQSALTLTAHDFADAVNSATLLTAAGFKVSRIGSMWKRRVGGIMTRLRRIAGRGAVTVVDGLDADDVPTAALDRQLKPYLEATQQLLDAVGERLAAAATQALADGLEAGDSIDQLQQRLVDLFSQDGTQLGASRAERIAMTEATRAFNAGALAAAQELTGPDRPLVKQWVTRRDTRVREAHADTNGQLQLLDDAFDVGGTPMQYPGDPTAPAALTVNCRCVLRVAAAARPDGTASLAADGTGFQSTMPPQLKAYWLTGEGAAKVRWGTPGSFDRCVRNLRDDFPQDPEGLCANLYHEATGHWPGQKKDGAAVNPDGTVHTGAMVALLPSQADMDRLALEGGEPADQLHVTMFYLGDAVDWSPDARGQVISGMAYAARTLTPVRGHIFGGAQWNPGSDEPAYVWNVGDDQGGNGSRLADTRYEVQYALEDRHDGPDLPQQHSPWVAHICAAYGKADLDAMAERVGPVTLDRLVVAFGGEWTVIPLTAGGFAPGDRVCVTGEPHDPGHGCGTVAEVNEGPAYGIVFDGMEGMGVHRWYVGDELAPSDEQQAPADVAPMELEAAPPMTWSTPGSTALAFENQQTGDGRVFAPGALYWEGSGPWPLQFAEEMMGGHDGARLAGGILGMGRDGDRIAAHGVMYQTSAGWEAASLLAQGAPLGVSVDLDDVDLEMVDASPEGVLEAYYARLVTASLVQLEDGGFMLTGEAPVEVTAGAVEGLAVAESSRVMFTVGPDGTVPAAAFELSAAAGDTDRPDGLVVDAQRSGEYLMRITRARVRGATLVTIPAYADARIVLDDAAGYGLAASSNAAVTASATSDYDRVVKHVVRTSLPSTATSVARYLKISITAARRHLARAARKGDLVKLHRGAYVAPTETDTGDGIAASATASVAGVLDLGDSLTASASGSVDLPVADRGTSWDGDAAKRRVLDWADGDCDKAGQAFAYRDDAVDDCTQANAWKLGYADVVDGTLTIIPDGAAAALAAVNGARGGADLGGDTEAVRTKLEAVRAHVNEATGGDGRDTMEASAWTAMRGMPAMPAAWFADPTDLLEPGGPGVNYDGGRIFGWVAQAGEPHAGHAKKITIDTLGNIDTTHFLRQRFTLDDGSTVKAGAFTMNAGHHRDGAECETAACQFDDTRTVAGIVTVGMSDRGMWFSGAAAPWMSDWDRSVFMATQPSYHMKKGPSGNWQLRAVLSVPVPGHSSALLASAVVERSQAALTAAAMVAEVDDAIQAEQDRQAADTAAVADTVTASVDIDYDRLADSLVAALARAEAKKVSDAAELEELLAEGRTMDSASHQTGRA